VNFPAKVLLFGEYTVIRGGSALALPLRTFHGRWGEVAPAHDWNPLLRFLDTCPELLDLPRLEQDIAQGHGFLSNIPQGKGLGSSGALVAALYHAYRREASADLAQIRTALAQLEGCYHGQSSGVDPLVSWVGKPLLLRGTDAPQTVELPEEDWQRSKRWFLVDSGVARHSAPLIAVFKRKTEDPAYQGRLRALEGMVEELVEAYQQFDEAHMGLGMEELSRLQLEMFSEMIPSEHRSRWEAALNSRQFAMKLCGAGGGGYFIAYRLKAREDSIGLAF
jgi:mevalonate kinase